MVLIMYINMNTGIDNRKRAMSICLTTACYEGIAEYDYRYTKIHHP